MESIMSRDPELEASFSFSCCDFNFGLAVFSDDEINGNNDDEYIEIALQQPTNSYAEDPESSSAQELEFRISFLSTVPFLEVNNSGLAPANTGESIGSEFETMTTPSSVSSSSTSTSTSTLSCSSTETRWAAAKSGAPAAAKPRESIKRRLQLTVYSLRSCLLIRRHHHQISSRKMAIMKAGK